MKALLAAAVSLAVVVVVAACANTDAPSRVGMYQETRHMQSPGKGRCSADRACEGNQSCHPPGVPDSPGCGTCFSAPDQCKADEDCKRGSFPICEPMTGPCICAPARRCVEGCPADATCGPQERCGPSHRCVPRVCRNDDDCERHFRCDAKTLACARQVCNRESDCLGGYCVDSACYDSPGTCHEPPPPVP